MAFSFITLRILAAAFKKYMNSSNLKQFKSSIPIAAGIHILETMLVRMTKGTKIRIYAGKSDLKSISTVSQPQQIHQFPMQIKPRKGAPTTKNNSTSIEKDNKHMQLKKEHCMGVKL